MWFLEMKAPVSPGQDPRENVSPRATLSGENQFFHNEVDMRINWRDRRGKEKSRNKYNHWFKKKEAFFTICLL